MLRDLSKWGFIGLSLTLTVSAGNGAVVTGDPTVRAVPGRAALNLALRFASAIESDPKDRARAQQIVIEDLIAIGAVDDAVAAASKLEGWRRGVILAELARQQAEAGHEEKARTLLAQAEEFRKEVKGWENPRIAAHIAEGLAALGETERVRGFTDLLLAEDERQYSGRSAAAQAIGTANQGDFAAGMAKLAALDAETDYEAALWRTTGYLELARSARASAEQKQAALTAARRSADTIAGFKQAETLETIAERFYELGDIDAAREALRAAEPVALSTPKKNPERAAMLATLAKSWGKIGATGRARELLKEAESAVPNALNIEQPGILAFIAAGYLELGKASESDVWQIYDRAMSAAESLVNARPRALSAVEICRSIGLEQADIRPQDQARLEALLRGLKAPW